VKRHPTDMVSLVFGLAFIGIAAWWLVARYVDLRVPHFGWFAAGALILFGLLGVIASLRGGEDRANGNGGNGEAYATVGAGDTSMAATTAATGDTAFRTDTVSRTAGDTATWSAGDPATGTPRRFGDEATDEATDEAIDEDGIDDEPTPVAEDWRAAIDRPVSGPETRGSSEPPDTKKE
jgi:hypothetical protein